MMTTPQRPLALMAATLLATSAWCASSPEFLAASVRLSKDQNPIPGNGGIGEPIPAAPVATLTFTHTTLKGLLSRAYSLRIFQISGPSWMESVYYDVSAKVPPGARRPQIAEMLQKLLIDRFQMQVRLETRPENGWALVLGPPPLKLPRTSLPGEPTADDPEGVPSRTLSFTFKPGSQTNIQQGASMYGLALGLWASIGQPVQDATGLKGAFDISLECDQDEPMARLSPATLRSALRKYGLDLVRQQVQTKRLMVDSAAKIPKPN